MFKQKEPVPFRDGVIYYLPSGRFVERRLFILSSITAVIAVWSYSIILSLRDGRFSYHFPGISCLATIMLSLRDKTSFFDSLLVC